MEYGKMEKLYGGYKNKRKIIIWCRKNDNTLKVYKLLNLLILLKLHKLKKIINFIKFWFFKINLI